MRARCVRPSPQQNNHFREMCSGSEAGSHLRLRDSWITQLKAQGPSRTCNESKAEEEEESISLSAGATPCPLHNVFRGVLRTIHLRDILEIRW